MIDLHKISGVQNSLLTSTGSDKQIRTGDVISVKVIESSAGSTWKVSIGGRIYNAGSDLSLKPGDILSVQAQWRGEKLHLKLPEGPVNPVAIFLKQAGLPVNNLTQSLVTSFIRNGKPLDPQLIDSARKLLEKTSGSVERNARFLSLLYGKGLSFFPSPGTDFVNGFFNGNDSGGDGGPASGRDGNAMGYSGGSGQRGSEQKNKHPEHEATDSLRKVVIDRTDRQGTSYNLFNHLREGSKHWVIIPIQYTAAETGWKGQIRMLLDDTIQKTVCLVVSVSDGNSGWSFLLDGKDGEKTLKVYAEDEKDRRAAEQFLHEFGKIMEGFGIAVPEKVLDEEGFDGFSGDSSDSLLKRIDVSL